MPDLEPRIAVLESKVDDIEGEQLRSRGRLHDLESDRAVLRLLSRQMGDLVNNMEQVAIRAAEKAITLALQGRDDRHDRETGMRLKLVGTGIALGGFAVAVLTLILTYHG